MSRIKVGDYVERASFLEAWEWVAFSSREPGPYQVTSIDDALYLQLNGCGFGGDKHPFSMGNFRVVGGAEGVADPVNQPQHYQFFPDLEAIEVIARSTTQEQFYGYCLGNRLKYRLRAGNKDELEQDIAKSDKYLELYEQYKGLCYGDEVQVPVPMLNLGDLEECYA